MAQLGSVIPRLLAVALLTLVAACTTLLPVDTFTLTVAVDGTGAGTVTSDPAGIDVTSGDEPGTLAVADGTTVTLTATAAAGSTFTGWTGACAGTDPCDLVMDADAAVTATFTLDPIVETRTLTVAVDGAGVGTVTSAPAGIDVTSGEDGPDSADFAEGATVTLTAAAAAGSTFAGWTGACAGANPCVLDMDADVGVTATFTLDPVATTRTLTVTVLGDGTGAVTSVPAGIDVGSGDAPDSLQLASGTHVALTAVAEAGSSFQGWTGGPCAGTGVCVLTLDANVGVTATFTLDPRPLTVAVVAGGAASGSVTSDPPGIDTAAADFGEPFDANTVVTLTATADATTPAGAFSGWVGGGCDDVRVPECTVTMDTAKSVTATFNEIQELTVRTGANTDDGVEFLGNSVAGQGFDPVQWLEGWVWTNRVYLDLGWAPFHNLTEAAFRFPGVTVPAGATIRSAVLQVTAAAAEPDGGGFPTTGALSLTIEGEKSLAPAALVQPAVTETNFNVTTRSRTDESVVWNIAADWAAGQEHQAPDASAILQEIVDQAGWASGNPVMLLLKGGTLGDEIYRRVHTFDSGAPNTRHPTLLIEYVVKPAIP